MVLIAYIGYALLVFILAHAVGASISALKGRANFSFVVPGSLAIMGLLFGTPCYFVGMYLRDNGNKGFSLLILLIAGSFGVFIGLQNRA